MATINSQTGDATAPAPGERGVIIINLVNSSGRWGKGFAAALDKLSGVPKAAYIALGKQHNGNIPLGEVQFVEMSPGKFVANMCAQSGKSLDYAAFENCLQMICLRAIRWGYDIHASSGLGSGMAGGDRQKIRDIIERAAQYAEKGKFATEWQRTGGVPPLPLNITLWTLPVAMPSVATPSVATPPVVAAVSVPTVSQV
jgi:hypothetical protein